MIEGSEVPEIANLPSMAVQQRATELEQFEARLRLEPPQRRDCSCITRLNHPAVGASRFFFAPDL